VNLRHAVLLASVGWYLMMPPSSGRYGETSLAPLSKWAHPWTFDSEHDCETALAATHVAEASGIAATELYNRIEEPAGRIPFGSLQWKCIATDDPRLTGK
jgi:hypothetical protein